MCQNRYLRGVDRFGLVFPGKFAFFADLRRSRIRAGKLCSTRLKLFVDIYVFRKLESLSVGGNRRGGRFSDGLRWRSRSGNLFSGFSRRASPFFQLGSEKRPLLAEANASLSLPPPWWRVLPLSFVTRRTFQNESSNFDHDLTLNLQNFDKQPKIFYNLGRI